MNVPNCKGRKKKKIISLFNKKHKPHWLQKQTLAVIIPIFVSSRVPKCITIEGGFNLKKKKRKILQFLSKACHNTEPLIINASVCHKQEIEIDEIFPWIIIIIIIIVIREVGYLQLEKQLNGYRFLESSVKGQKLHHHPFIYFFFVCFYPFQQEK